MKRMNPHCSASVVSAYYSRESVRCPKQ